MYIQIVTVVLISVILRNKGFIIIIIITINLTFPFTLRLSYVNIFVKT